MTRLRMGASTMIALGLLTACASSQKVAVTSPTSPFGSEARLRVLDGRRTVTVKGELLAVDSNHVWLLIDKRPTTISRAQVTDVRARAHRYDGSRGMAIGLIGGAATGVGMVAACSSVEDAECGPMLIVWESIWLIVSGISALFMDANSWDKLPLDNWSRIAAYARFPQGVPPSFTAEPYTTKP